MLRTTLFFLTLLCYGLCCEAHAVTLIATESVIASGVFNGTPFNDALVTLTGTIDFGTLEVDNPPDGFAGVSLVGNATVTVGGATDTLTGRSVNPANGSMFNGTFALNSTGLSVTGNTYTGADIGFEAEVLILSTSDTGANYATTLTGPGSYSGRAGIAKGYEFATASGGYLQINTAASNATFTIAAVPEPTSLVLACLSTVGGALVVFRKRCRR